jgi:hypothetical protein
MVDSINAGSARHTARDQRLEPERPTSDAIVDLRLAETVARTYVSLPKRYLKTRGLER